MLGPADERCGGWETCGRELASASLNGDLWTRLTAPLCPHIVIQERHSSEWDRLEGLEGNIRPVGAEVKRTGREVQVPTKV